MEETTMKKLIKTLAIFSILGFTGAALATVAVNSGGRANVSAAEGNRGKAAGPVGNTPEDSANERGNVATGNTARGGVNSNAAADNGASNNRASAGENISVDGEY